MMLKPLLLLLAVASLLSAFLASEAEARGHRGGHHHCRDHHHLDYGTNRCVRNS